MILLKISVSELVSNHSFGFLRLHKPYYILIILKLLSMVLYRYADPVIEPVEFDLVAEYKFWTEPENDLADPQIETKSTTKKSEVALSSRKKSKKLYICIKIAETRCLKN